MYASIALGFIAQAGVLSDSGLLGKTLDRLSNPRSDLY